MYSNIMNEVNIGVIKLKKEDYQYLSLEENKNSKKFSHN